MAPVEKATATLKPPVKQATETVAAPPGAPVKKVAAPLGHMPTDSTGSFSGSIARAAGTAGGETVGTATRDARETVDAPMPTTRALPSPAGEGDATSAALVNARDSGGPQAQADGVTPVAPRDGSVRAPLPKWMAYIWPAIALTRPGLANLLDRWEQTGLRLALRASVGSSGGFGVAGVHASHSVQSGRPTSPSLLSRIPPAISHALSPGSPTSALAYLCLLGLVVIVVFTAVSREIAVGRRQGRG